MSFENSRISASIWSAALAWFIANDAGIPVWRDWDMGDRVDISTAAFFLMWSILTALRSIREVRHGQ